MKSFFGNLASVGEAKNENGIFRLNNAHRSDRNANRPGRRRDPVQERMAAKERELRLREMEDKRIADLREEIFRVKDSDMSDELINLTVSMLNEKINSIFMQRAEREQIAIDRELQRKQQELDERMRERERVAQENRRANKSEEELEAYAERSEIRSMTKIGARMDNIGELRRTRASMEASATRLRGEADFDEHRTRIANEQIRSFVLNHNLQNPGNPMSAGHFFASDPLSADYFRGRHLQNLNAGIVRTTGSINQQIGALYRDSQNLQEEQLRISREKLRAPSQEDDDENKSQKIDLRL